VVFVVFALPGAYHVIQILVQSTLDERISGRPGKRAASCFVKVLKPKMTVEILGMGIRSQTKRSIHPHPQMQMNTGRKDIFSP
jgi:hypothetical protein